MNVTPLKIEPRLPSPLLKIGQRHAIITAHPDDEVLWAGGLPLRYAHRDWTIICCSIPRIDPQRAWKFFDACAVLQATPRLLPITEANPHEPLWALETLYPTLEEFDCLVTHNAVGEYHHPHHAQVSAFVRSHFAGPIYTFGWRPEGKGEYELKLSAQELERKMTALKCYDHVLPYAGREIPKWEALIERYVHGEGLDLSTETYD